MTLFRTPGVQPSLKEMNTAQRVSRMKFSSTAADDEDDEDHRATVMKRKCDAGECDKLVVLLGMTVDMI